MKTYCNLPFERLKFTSSGDYQSCCHQTAMYGNIIKENVTIEDAFNNPLLLEVQRAAMNGKLHPICANSTCPFFTKIDQLDEISTSEVEYNPKRPIDVEISLPSTHCNIGGTNPTKDTACIMCPRASAEFMKWEPKEDQTDKIVEKIKPYMSELSVLNIQGIAEPFWKGKVLEIFDKLDWDSHKDHILFWSFSNGTVFGEKIQDEFIDRVTRCNIGFSIDAATPETYKKLRRLDFFDTVERNVRRYFTKIKSLQNEERYFHAFTTYNINTMNVHEMEQMVRWSHGVGADRTEFTLTFNGSPTFELGDQHLCNESNWKIFWQGQQKALAVAKELNYHLDFYVPFHGGFLNT